MNFEKDPNGDMMKKVSPGGIRGFEKGFNPATGQKNGQFDRIKNLTT